MDHVYLWGIIVGGVGFLVSGVTGIIQAFTSWPPIKPEHQKWLYITITAFFIISIVSGLANSLTGCSSSPTPTPPVIVGSSSSTPIPTTTPTASSERMLAYEHQSPTYPLNERNNWDRGTFNKELNATCAFTPEGRYDAKLTHASTASTPSPSFCHGKQQLQQYYALIEAKVTIKGGHDNQSGEAGLLFRDQYYNNGTRGYYSLHINGNTQQFKVTKDGNSFPNLDWQNFPSGVQTGSTHTLQVITEGGTFYLFIDKKFAAQVTDLDNAYIAGSIGFVSYNPQGSNLGEAIFSDVSVHYLIIL